MKVQERLLFVTILLHHIYIMFLNTSSVHGLSSPDKTIWTFFLILFLLVLIYFYLREPAETWYEKLLYFAIILSVAAGILRSFSISTDVRTYSIFLVVIAVISTIPLVIHEHRQIKFMLLGIYSLEIVLLVSRVFDITSVIQIIGPITELMIVLGILYYNYSLGFAFDELFVVIIFTLTGWYLGDFIYSFDVPALIISTLFEQTLSLGQYSIISGIEPQFFLALHMAEVFNILIVQFLTRRSWTAMAIIIAGLDMTYPPLLGLRALLLLIFLRKTVKKKEVQETNASINSSSEESAPESE